MFVRPLGSAGSGDSNTLAVVAVIAAVLLVGLGCFCFARSRGATAPPGQQEFNNPVYAEAPTNQRQQRRLLLLDVSKDSVAGCF